VTPRIIRNYVGSVELSEASDNLDGAAPQAKKVEQTPAAEPADGETPIVEAPKPQEQPAEEKAVETAPAAEKAAPAEKSAPAPAAPAPEEDEGWN
jgi:hypothetical protein